MASANSDQTSKSPLVCVVMAAWQPNAEFFRQQIASIRGQTYQNWRCVIHDDCSDEAHRQMMRAALGDDGRFELVHGNARRGVYHNFEAALRLVPADAELICYADQDDFWEPHKLARLVEPFAVPEVVLAHSDLSLVDSEGRELHPSCWRWEGRNTRVYRLHLLVLRNTVTGCSLMFRRGLLELILPFPKQTEYQVLHHDRWTALMATAVGRLEAVDEPLVRYRQHGDNVLGALSQSLSRSRWTAIGREYRSGGLRRVLSHSIYRWRSRAFISRLAHERLQWARERGLSVQSPCCNLFSSKIDFGLRAALLWMQATLRCYRGGGSSFVLGKCLHDVLRIVRRGRDPQAKR